MPLKVKINRISIYYLMYKHLYNMALNLDVAFLLSVSISLAGIVFFTMIGSHCYSRSFQEIHNSKTIQI